ncbi:MAG TPA: hypothetical protein PKV92_08340 [Thermodesulfovibrio thiophilus]|nr:hypothetical protein [Thermodesulfovibrio thiophilus]HQD37086.1 hypothetical protein [Thermodesulfovibrio thiophilus]
MKITFKVNTNTAFEYIKGKVRETQNILRNAIDEGIENFDIFFRGTILSGSPIKERSGRLKRSISIKHPRAISKDVFQAEYSVGGSKAPYATSLIRSNPLTIFPKSASYLAIPFSKTNYDEFTGSRLYKSPRQIADAKIFNNIVWQGKKKSDLIPMFLLRQSVTLDTRVSPTYLSLKMNEFVTKAVSNRIGLPTKTQVRSSIG